jgi:hypothetical protein
MVEGPMEDHHKKNIEKLKTTINCPKAFACVESEFENLCQAKDYILNDHLECLEKIPESCKFAFSLGYKSLCSCPLRVYLLKELKM